MAASDYHDKANDTVLALAMIETARRSRISTTSLSTPESRRGLCRSVGPLDLARLAAGLDKDHEAMIAKRAQRCSMAAAGIGIKAGIHTGSTAYAKRMFDMGFDFVTVMGDAA